MGQYGVFELPSYGITTVKKRRNRFIQFTTILFPNSNITEEWLGSGYELRCQWSDLRQSNTTLTGRLGLIC